MAKKPNSAKAKLSLATNEGQSVNDGAYPTPLEQIEELHTCDIQSGIDALQSMAKIIAQGNVTPGDMYLLIYCVKEHLQATHDRMVGSDFRGEGRSTV